MRYRKIFPKDIKSYTVLQDLTHFTRLGTIVEVNPEAGTCSIRWLDRPGFRADAILTQGSHKEWNIPERGAVVLVQTDPKDQARIVRYINLGHQARIQKDKSLPKLKEGEKLWEGGNNSYIYMKRNGDIEIVTGIANRILLQSSTNTTRSEAVNWHITTQAGDMYLGYIQRPVTNSDGTQSLNLITDSGGNVLTEYRIRVVETEDTSIGSSGLSSPLFDIIVGTVVNDSGIPITKNSVPTTATASNALCVRILVKRSGTTLFSAYLSKDGKMDITAANDTVMSFLQNLVLTAASIVMNSGEKGAARDGDSVQVTIPVGTFSVQGTLNPTPVTVSGEITEGSNTVKIGD